MSLDPIVTHVAHTGSDELQFQGHRVFADLLGATNVGQILMLGMCGFIPDADQLAVIDDIVTAMSSADPRLWPFKVTRLASSHGNAAYGVAATLISGEGGMYGSNRMKSTAQWLRHTVAGHDVATISDDQVERLLDAETKGFGVLYRSHDERFDALVRRAAEAKYDRGPHTAFCLHARRVARERKQTEAHVYLLIAALCLDIGLSVEAISALATLFLFHDALANAVEGASQAPSVLQRLPVDCVDYRGAEPRRSPRAAASSGE